MILVVKIGRIFDFYMIAIIRFLSVTICIDVRIKAKSFQFIKLIRFDHDAQLFRFREHIVINALVLLIRTEAIYQCFVFTIFLDKIFYRKLGVS